MAKLISTNPADNSVIGEVEVSSGAEVIQKVRKAHEAKATWRDLGVGGRTRLLRGVVEEITKRREEIAELVTREMGMPITLSRIDVDDAAAYLTWYLDNAEKYLSSEVTFEDALMVHRVYREPLGVAAVIVPWNFPISNFVWGTGQNLIAGNAVVFKHSEETPLSGKLIEEILGSVGLPVGVFSEVYGDGKVGEALVRQNIDLISFTGSTATGKKLYKIAAEKMIRIVMELGGSAPGIVFEDAPESLIGNVYGSRFVNCGQACDALKRLIVHESRYEEVVEGLRAKLTSLKVGNPLEEATDIGPLVAERQVRLLEAQVDDALKKGAKALIGGKRANLSGAFYQPTLLTGIKPDMRVWQEEVFGPVLPVVSFQDEEEAIRLANNTTYGLGSYVFSADQKRAERVASRIQAGMVSINGVSYNKACSPFGGYKHSGIGREHGKFGFEEVTQVKVIASPQ